MSDATSAETAGDFERRDPTTSATAAGGVDPARSPIFIIGTGRSGTSLLRMMLCAHPRIYLTHEASFYVWNSLFPGRRSGRDFLRYFFQTFSFRWLGLSPAEVMADLAAHLSDVPAADLPRDRAHEAFTALMRVKAARYGRVRFGDKTPSHAAALPQIFRDYPDARVIHIVRDPRGVVMSLSRMPWASRSINANAVFIETERRQVAPFRDRICEVRLEDLLGDTRASMARVLEFVGEPWDDAVLDHARHIPDPNDMPPFEWLRSAARDRGTPRARWADLPPEQIRLIEHLCRKSMEQFGYEPATLDDEPAAWARWRTRLADLPEALRFAGVYARVGLRYRDPKNFDTEATRQLFARVNPRAWDLYEGDVLPDPPALAPDWDAPLPA